MIARFCLACFMAAPALALEPDPASHWAGFRGPDSSGLAATDAVYPSDLSAAGVLQWKTEIPVGHSSPIVVGDAIYVTGYEPGKLSTLAYDLATGALRWRRDVEAPAFEKTYQHGPATPTPVSDGQQVFTVFGSFGILAYDLEGNEIWRQARPIQKNMFGSASSPAILDGKLIVFAGGESDSLLQAIEPATGKILWERKRAGPASSWATPVLWRASEKPAVLVYEPFHLRAILLADGTDLWSVPNLADEPVTTPQQIGDLVYTTSYNLRTNLEAIGLPTFDALLAECDADGDKEIDKTEVKKNKSILSRPDADGQGDHPLSMFFRMLDVDKSGKISEAEWPKIKSWMESWNHANGLLALRANSDGSPPTLAWEHSSGVPECPSPIIVGDKIYMVRNGGVVTCVSARDGKQIYKERLASGGPYYASPVSADGKIYMSSERGVITILAASGEPKSIATYDLGEPIWATPALTNGQIIVRGEKHLYRFALSK
jgi:outer membrane protein assembly factor BamB